MTAPTLRELLADVLRDVDDHDQAPGYDEMADALLASPLAAIIDLAAFAWVQPNERPLLFPDLTPEVRALLADWRASRAEQEPER